VLRGEAAYPEDLETSAAQRHVRLLLCDADGLARQAGSVRAANVVLLGATSAVLPFREEAWEQSLAVAIPAKILELNRRAFALGRQSCLEREASQ
jgi:indolepyruvate ferredoxin oxidoreductase beta subunit